MEMKGLHKEIELTGGYATKGKLFRVPINSKGTLLFTLSKGIYFNPLNFTNLKLLIYLFKPIFNIIEPLKSVLFTKCLDGRIYCGK